MNAGALWIIGMFFTFGYLQKLFKIVSWFGNVILLIVLMFTWPVVLGNELGRQKSSRRKR